MCPSPVERSFDAAVEALEGLVGTHYRPKGKDAAASFANLKTWADRLALGDALTQLSVIHVAGTKGKGSTCAFTERILRACGRRTGMFTSPHLIDVRERIQIDGTPVDKDIFALHFWHCYDTLNKAATPELGLPPYFYFLTLLAVRIFHVEGVDVAVVEVGLGGRFDATNLVPAPVVCGITSLGYDHMEVLGHTLTLIAGEKAGIMKRGVPCVTTTQPDEAAAVLESTAQQLQVPLQIAPCLDAFAFCSGGVRLGLAGKHQRLNAAMAIQLCRIWAQRARPSCEQSLRHEKQLASMELPEEYAHALAHTSWPGRAQVIADADVQAEAVDNLVFCLDGAHTGESAATCAEWFADEAGEDSVKVLLFNCLKEREPDRLLTPLVSVLAGRGMLFTHAMFVPPEPVTKQKANERRSIDLSWQNTLRQHWDELQLQKAAPLDSLQQPASEVVDTPVAALAAVRRMAREVHPTRMHVLVTGSLYLVGNLLRLLKR